MTIHFISFHLPPSGCIQVCVCVCACLFLRRKLHETKSVLNQGLGYLRYSSPQKNRKVSVFGNYLTPIFVGGSCNLRRKGLWFRPLCARAAGHCRVPEVATLTAAVAASEGRLLSHVLSRNDNRFSSHKIIRWVCLEMAYACVKC